MPRLDLTQPEAELRRPFPAHSFRFEIDGDPDLGGPMFD
jgi:hypothetical protein